MFFRKIRVTNGMKKSIRKRWLKTAAIIGTLVLLVLSLVVFGVPKLIDHLYPNPTEGKTWSRPRDFELYTWVENQISASSPPLNNVTAYKIGAGKYQIDQTYYSQFSGKVFTESFRLNRGEMEDYRHEGGGTLLGEGSLGPLGYYDRSTDGSESWDALLQQVEELPASSWVNVEMMLSEPLDLEGVRSLAATTELEVVVKKKDLQKVLESNQVTNVRLNDVSLISLNLGEQEHEE